MKTARRGWLALCCVLGLVGCAGGDELVGSSSSSALGASPLPEVERVTWESAAAGCEGLLDDDGLEWSFGVAEGAPELVVVVDPYGGAVCADTYSAVDEELRAIGSKLVDDLWISYVTTLQELEVYSGMTQSNQADGSHLDDIRAPLLGEPNPQPNRPGGDPLPEIEERENDPNPQPNDPTGESSNDGTTTTTTTGESFQPNVNEPTETVETSLHGAGI